MRQGRLELPQEPRAREPVLGPLPRALFWAASACFCYRADGLSASGLVPPAGARRPESAQALAQQAAKPRDQALKPPGGQHSQPFPFNNIL